jgi:hypothetical protein
MLPLSNVLMPVAQMKTARPLQALAVFSRGGERCRFYFLSLK